MKSPSSEQIAWAGGLFEGEGNFYAKDGFRPVAQLSTTDEDTMDRFFSIVGTGHKNGPYEYTQNRKPFFHWAVGGVEPVKAFASLIWVWLGDRRQWQFDEVIRKHTEHAEVKAP